MRVDGSIGPAIRTGRDLSGRERGERRLSADLANRRTPARNVAQPFSVARKFCQMRTGTRVAREFERHALTHPYTVPILW
jgi:hypothetical protein